MRAHAADDRTCFEKALSEGDPKHACHHLAALMAEGRTKIAEEALGKLIAACDEPLVFAVLGENAYVGSVALRAVLVARRPDGANEATSLLLQAQSAVPDVDLLAWLAEPLASPAFVESLELDGLASIAYPMGAHHAVARRVADMLDVVRRAREPNARLALTAARVRRMSGDVDGAIAVAEEEHARAPSYATSIARASAYRERGRMEEAIAAYGDAIAFNPEDLAARLDIGDLSLSAGDRAGAAKAYAEVLAREPTHDWAWPSQLHLLAREGDEAARSALGMLAAGGHERARTLWNEIEPYALTLEPPESSAVGAVRDALARGYDLASMAISSLEPPSAIASMRKALALAGKTSDIEVTFAEIPSPDPRAPSEEVAFQLWAYEGASAHPAMEPPREDVALAIAAMAAERYEPSEWAARAHALAATAPARDVLATMVHPPHAPDGMMPWDWMFRVQVAAAFVACRMKEPKAAMHSLLHGPLDWSTTAAIVAMTEHANEMNDGAPMLAELLELSTSPIHHGCVFRPLVYCLLRRTNLAAHLRAPLLAMRKNLESE